MKVLVSGGTGLVGRYIVEGLLAADYQVIIGGRKPPPAHLFPKPVGFVPLCLDPDRDQTEAFDDAYLFVHAAFDHFPGRYRGGEGDDPVRFRRLNLDGTVQLFETARRAGTRRAVFLSSRAVYDGLPTGTILREDMDLSPDSLYGEIKLNAEGALADLSGVGFSTASLRLTGVYGDLRPGKWEGLFADFLAEKPIPARAGTEVHGRDIAAAVRLMLETEAARIDGQSFNLSDIVTDTREILGYLPQRGGVLPPHANFASLNVMATEKIEALGWRPGGRPLLARTVEALAGTLNAA